MLYVVGSGPSGVACATALIQKGLRVTMLDVGNAVSYTHLTLPTILLV